MMFLPYIDSEHCTQYGYRYSMSNCVFESALEAVLGKCKCCPIFHMKYCKSKQKLCFTALLLGKFYRSRCFKTRNNALHEKCDSPKFM